MKIAFLFPGQGAQSVGMGKDLYLKYEEVKNIYDKVKELTGIDVAKISFDGEEELLNQTKNTQICILTMSLAILEVLNKNDITAEISSGLSLGEYTSLIYSKAIGFDDGIKLVQKRGEYMQDLVPKGEWLMAALLGASEEQVKQICSNVKNGFVVPANFNCTGQIVLSGDKQGIEQAEQIAKEIGVKKVRILKTSGPFHTEKLIEASKALKKELRNIEIHELKTKVIKNLDGKAYTDQDDIREILAKHIISPVRFSTGLQTMLDMGIDTFIEVGPGKTLSGFIKRMETNETVKVLNINNVETLENTIEFIKSKMVN